MHTNYSYIIYCLASYHQACLKLNLTIELKNLSLSLSVYIVEKELHAYAMHALFFCFRKRGNEPMTTE